VRTAGRVVDNVLGNVAAIVLVQIGAPHLILIWNQIILCTVRKVHRTLGLVCGDNGSRRVPKRRALVIQGTPGSSDGTRATHDKVLSTLQRTHYLSGIDCEGVPNVTNSAIKGTASKVLLSAKCNQTRPATERLSVNANLIRRIPLSQQIKHTKNIKMFYGAIGDISSGYLAFAVVSQVQRGHIPACFPQPCRRVYDWQRISTTANTMHNDNPRST
jgi:hypothetical protein